MTDGPPPISDRDIVAAIGRHFANGLLEAVRRDPDLPGRFLAGAMAIVVTDTAVAAITLDEIDIHQALRLDDDPTGHGVGGHPRDAKPGGLYTHFPGLVRSLTEFRTLSVGCPMVGRPTFSGVRCGCFGSPGRGGRGAGQRDP